MSEHLPGFGWRSRFRCHEKDVLQAFRATGLGIRTLLSNMEKEENPEPLAAAHLADRIREQRELVRQILLRKQWKRAKHLLRINAHLRQRFLDLIGRTGLPVNLYALRCKSFGGSASMS